MMWTRSNCVRLGKKQIHIDRICGARRAHEWADQFIGTPTQARRPARKHARTREGNPRRRARMHAHMPASTYARTLARTARRPPAAGKACTTQKARRAWRPELVPDRVNEDSTQCNSTQFHRSQSKSIELMCTRPKPSQLIPIEPKSAQWNPTQRNPIQPKCTDPKRAQPK